MWSRDKIDAQSFAAHEVDIADYMVRWKRVEKTRSRRWRRLPGLRPRAYTDEHQQDCPEAHVSHE